MAPLPRYSRYSKMQRVPLAKTDGVYALLADAFCGSVLRHRHLGRVHPPPHLEVVAIEALHNPRLQSKYHAEVEDIAGITDRRVRRLSGITALPVQTFAGHELNEHLLYHGVPHGLVDRIAAQGADVRYAGEHAGKLFGTAIYLAENASKSDIYTTASTSGERAVFVMRTCLGEVHETSVAMKTATRPPERPDGRGPLDSVRALTRASGGCVDHPEFMVYKNNQVLPE